MAHEFKIKNGMLLGDSTQALSSIQTTLRAAGTAVDTAIATESAVRTALDGLVPLTLTELTTGFSIAGGSTTSKTLTVTENCTIDQSLASTNSPTFAGVTLSGLTTDGFVTTSSGVLSSKATVDFGDITSADVDTQTGGGLSTSDSKLATSSAIKNYVDTVAQGLDQKESVVVGTTTEDWSGFIASGSGQGKTLTASSNATSHNTIDGVTVSVGDRILVKNDPVSSDVNNGIYTVTTLGDGSSTSLVLTRATDFDGTPSSEVSGGAYTFIEQGTSLAETGWVVSSNGAITVDTDSIAWTQFNGAGNVVAGVAMTKSGNTLSVGDGTTGTRHGLKFLADDIQIDYNNVSLTIDAGTNQLNTVQDISTSGSPTFLALTVSGITSTMLKTDGSGTISTAIADTDYQQAVTWGDGLAYSSGTASVDYNSTNLTITSNQIDTIQSIATSASPTFAGATLNGDVAIGSGGALTLDAGLKDGDVTTTIPFGDGSNTALTNFTATSIVGALNEVRSDIDNLEQDVIEETITQASHGFSVGDVIYYNGTAYAKAQADTAAHAEAVGVVGATNGNNFTVVYGGRITVAGASWTAGDLLYLSSSLAGALTSSAPADGYVNKPMVIATSSTSGVVINHLGIITTVTVFENDNLDASSTVTVDSFADTDGDSVVWHYTIISSDGSNRRAGTLQSCWNDSNDTVEYSETSTNDIGDTSDITLAVDINSNSVRCRATNGGSTDDWLVRVKRFLF